jgi:phosphoribosylamine-glycine ligase
LIIGNNNITYIESDSRLGDPENCLLNEMIGRKEFGELLIAVANDELIDISTKYTAGLGIVLAPSDYPYTSSSQTISGNWVKQLGGSGELYLGKVRYLDNSDLHHLSSSRSGVYVRVGTELGSVASAAYGSLSRADIPDRLDYRSDIAK